MDIDTFSKPLICVALPTEFVSDNLSNRYLHIIKKTASLLLKLEVSGLTYKSYKKARDFSRAICFLMICNIKFVQNLSFIFQAISLYYV